jgi:hypothetical protein
MLECTEISKLSIENVLWLVLSYVFYTVYTHYTVHKAFAQNAAFLHANFMQLGLGKKCSELKIWFHDFIRSCLDIHTFAAV